MRKYRYIEIRNILIYEIICLWVSFFIIHFKWSWFSKEITSNYITFNFAIIGICFAIYSLVIPKLLDFKIKKKLPQEPFLIIFREMKFSKRKLFISFSVGILMIFPLSFFENCQFNDFLYVIFFSIHLTTFLINFEILFDTANSIFLITDLDVLDSNEVV